MNETAPSYILSRFIHQYAGPARLPRWRCRQSRTEIWLISKKETVVFLKKPGCPPGRAKFKSPSDERRRQWRRKMGKEFAG